MNKDSLVTIDEIQYDVNYDYDEGEVGHWRDSNGTGTPDISAGVDINEIKINGSGNLYDHLKQDVIEQIELKLLET